MSLLTNLKLLTESLFKISKYYDSKVKINNMENSTVYLNENSYLGMAQFATNVSVLKFHFIVFCLCWFFCITGRIFVYNHFGESPKFVIEILIVFVILATILEFFATNKKFLTIFLHERIAPYYPILNPVRFALKNNFLANINVIYIMIANISFICYVVSLDKFYNKMSDLVKFTEEYPDKELLGIVPKNLIGFLKDLQHLQAYVILIYTIVSVIIFINLFMIGWNIRFKKPEIYKFDFDESGKGILKGTVKSDGITIVQKNNPPVVLDLTRQQINFLSDIIIVTQKNSFTIEFICKHDDIQKIIIQGTGISNEITFDLGRKKWIVQSVTP